MANPFKRTFDLVQHTPLIHFQHDQAGATLRATEVKAKLDRFIWEKFDKINFDNKFSPNLREAFLASEKKASPYKMSIFTNAESIDILIGVNINPEQEKALQKANIEFLSGTPYFALEESIRKDVFKPTGQKVKRHPNDNKERDELCMEKDYKEKIGLWGKLLGSDKKITLEVFSTNAEVLSIIEKSIHAFFACTNFGSRQTKGFGSFSVEYPKSKESFEKLVEPFFKHRYSLTQEFNGNSSIGKLKAIFSRIQDDYRLIKSGRPAQMSGGYRKAQTFLFGLKPNYKFNWDKRHIKIEINNNRMKVGKDFANLLTDPRKPGNSAIYDSTGANSWMDASKQNYIFIRALLGLAEQYEFQTDKGFNNKYQVAVKHEFIERYPSPIIWKVVNNKVYVLANEVESVMLDKTFELTMKLGDPKTNNPKSITPIKTPIDFSLGDFLKFVFTDSPEPVKGYQKF